MIPHLLGRDLDAHPVAWAVVPYRLSRVGRPTAANTVTLSGSPSSRAGWRSAETSVDRAGTADTTTATTYERFANAVAVGEGGGPAHASASAPAALAAVGHFRGPRQPAGPVVAWRC